MPKERSIIDFELIWKKINQALSAEEDQLLSKWLEESCIHRKFYEDVLEFYREGSSIEDVKSETERAWKVMSKQLQMKTRNSTRKFLSLSVAAASVFLVLSLMLWSKKNEPSHVLTEDSNRFKPIPAGGSKATLVLNDGSVHNISSSGKLLLTEGGAVISSEGTKLKYTEKDSIQNIVKYNTLKVPRGGEFSLQLSDGTKVWLNSETEMRYPVQFVGNERRVELIGEAYFEVTRNEKIPFFVNSGLQTVRVLGTEFNISSYREAKYVYTTLVNGSVEVFNNSRPEIRQLLSPNEQSALAKSGEEITKRSVDPYQYIAWKEGRFVFTDQNLDEIMANLSKWYDVEVVFDREELKNIRFTGNLRRYEDFGEMLKKIEKTHEVEFSVDNTKITIK